MWIAENWEDYKVLDTSNGEKLEDWGGYRLIRPDPQVIWRTRRTDKSWKRPNAHYHRSAKGGGEWEFFDLPETWDISYILGRNSEDLPEKRICFHLKPFAFKHTGVFPEQAVNWEWSYSLISRRISEYKKTGIDKPVRVLNLFAYTGGATMAAAAAGAEVVHVDASKGMVAWAKENAVSSGLGNAPVRYLVDDCVKFVEREIRRGNKYDAIIMDPPSYGRGPKGEIWKIEDSIYPFIELCSNILSDKPLFVLINSYTTGLQAGVLKYMLDLSFTNRFGGHSEASEIGIPVETLSAAALPEPQKNKTEGFGTKDIADPRFILPEGASGRYTGE